MSSIFFTRLIEGDLAILDGEEAAHLTQVLRRKPGDTVRLTDGKGTWFEGVLESISKKNAMLRIVSTHTEQARSTYNVHIAVAPTKNTDRLEWFLEKATEIGIDEITPIWCKHSERTTLRPDRLEKILLAAMKQSVQCFLPVLHPAVKLENFLAGLTNPRDARFIGYVDAIQESPHLFEVCPPGKDTVVLIGPEGDFSTAEVQHALQAGFKTVRLGSNRLRTETAALAAVQIVALRNEVLGS